MTTNFTWQTSVRRRRNVLDIIEQLQDAAWSSESADLRELLLNAVDTIQNLEQTNREQFERLVDLDRQMWKAYTS